VQLAGDVMMSSHWIARTRAVLAMFALLLVSICGVPGSVDMAAAATLVVDSSDPAAQDVGSGPYKSIRYALSRMMIGDRLTIRAGVYRETIDLRVSPAFAAMRAGADSTAETLIEGEGEVVIKGSAVVDNLEPLGSGLFVRRNWYENTQQVFVDGAPLQQIGGVIFGDFPVNPNNPLSGLHASDGGIWPGRTGATVEDMTPTSFFYDTLRKELYIKFPVSSLDGRLVEASVRPFGAYGDSLSNVRFRNLTFKHSNTTASTRAGFVSLSGKRIALENIKVLHADGIGLSMSGEENGVTNSTFNYCGRVGMMVIGKNAKLIDNETSYNNTRGFNKWWEAGGMKNIGEGGLKDSEIARHRALFNNGDGIWIDTGADNIRIHDSVLAYNMGFGIHYEASLRGYIYNNYAFNNGQRGIYIFQSSNSVVAHNLVVGSGLDASGVLDASRRDPTGAFDYQPKSNRIIGNVFAWNGQALLLPDPLAGNASDYNLYLDAGQRTVFTSIAVSGGGRQVTTLDHWRALAGQDMHSWRVQQGMPRSLFDEICALKPSPDFSSVLAMANAYVVSYGSSAWADIPSLIPVRTAPGPGQ
jgi:parallel beta-helix repeat protein